MPLNYFWRCTLCTIAAPLLPKWMSNETRCEWRGQQGQIGCCKRAAIVLFIDLEEQQNAEPDDDDDDDIGTTLRMSNKLVNFHTPPPAR